MILVHRNCSACQGAAIDHGDTWKYHILIREARFGHIPMYDETSAQNALIKIGRWVSFMYDTAISYLCIHREWDIHKAEEFTHYDSER